MSFQTPITIREALAFIEQHEYVLPAIQRRFVWGPEQISRLFDSLMRGYPIGSFLFWQVDRERARQFSFYDFVVDYHERDRPHCPRLNLIGDRPVIAVLDGQQRLTALNIGLRGRMAIKLPRKRRSNDRAYPPTRLYLNLLRDAADNEGGVTYDFRFLREGRPPAPTADQFWFPVWQILDFRDATQIFAYLQRHDLLSAGTGPFEALTRLHRIVCDERIINFYLEKDQDLDKVLNIFIRINSGGTILSYSDLLLSIATAQWSERDARAAIYELVDELNGTRMGFSISKDFVLKAGLMLTDIASVGFKVTNFNADNMKRLEERWDRIAGALRLTIRLVADFGFSDRTIRAVSALLPIAYYLYRREPGERFLRSKDHRDDREAIRLWLIRSLLKSGIWGSGLDTLLTAIRATIQAELQDGDGSFPAEAIEATMARRGRSLRFEEEEIQDLLGVSYSDRRAFTLLALMYDFVDLRNHFHVDHVFPRSRFSPGRLKKAGLDEAAAARARARYNLLPNLQLLDGTENQEKLAQMPRAWLEKHLPDSAARQALCDRHDLGALPADMSGFDGFFDARRERMAARMRAKLGVAPPAVDAPPAWDEEIFELLDDAWCALARGLMAAGLPEPDRVESELQRGGLTLEHRSILAWIGSGDPIALVDSALAVGAVDARVVPVAADAAPESVAAAVRAWLDASA